MENEEAVQRKLWKGDQCHNCSEVLFRPYALTYTFYIGTGIHYHWIYLQPRVICFLEMCMWILSMLLPDFIEFVTSDSWSYCIFLLTQCYLNLAEWVILCSLHQRAHRTGLSWPNKKLPTPNTTPDLALPKISLLKLPFWNSSRFGELVLNESLLPAAMKNIPKPSCLLCMEPREELSQLYILLIHWLISTIRLLFNVDLFWDLARN